MGEIADATASCAERASSGVGCSRKERVRSTTRSRSTRAGGYELVISPTASPAITGSIPDSSSATQTATPSTTAARPRHAGGAKRSANSVANSAAATASGTRSTSLRVRRGDHDQRDEVVDHRQRQQPDAQARAARGDEREHAQRERGVGRHRRAPAVRAVGRPR